LQRLAITGAFDGFDNYRTPLAKTARGRKFRANRNESEIVRWRVVICE